METITEEQRKALEVEFKTDLQWLKGLLENLTPDRSSPSAVRFGSIMGFVCTREVKGDKNDTRVLAALLGMVFDAACKYQREQQPAIAPRAEREPVNMRLYDACKFAYKVQVGNNTQDDEDGIMLRDAIAEAERILPPASDRAKAFARPDGTEGGAAGFRVELTEGAITVYHSEDKVQLARLDRAPPGTWDKLWAAMEALGIKRA